MDRIVLHNMEFFAYHGFYDEEQKIGNKYSVSISLYLDLSKPGFSDKLKDTVSYEEVYKFVKKVMDKPTRLLENIANNISESILTNYNSITKVEVSVSKYNPPIGGVCERAEVVISKSRPHS